MNCQFILSLDGAGFFLGKEKRWAPFICIFDQSGLDKLFSQEFLYPQCHREKKWTYSKRIVFMFQKLELCKNFSQVPLPLSVSVCLSVSLSFSLSTLLFLQMFFPEKGSRYQTELGKAAGNSWASGWLFQLHESNRNKAHSLNTVGIGKAKSNLLSPVSLVIPGSFSSGLLF